MINDIFYGKVPGVKEPSNKKSFLDRQLEIDSKVKSKLPMTDNKLRGSFGFRDIIGLNKPKTVNPREKIIAMTYNKNIKKPMIMSKPSFNPNKLKQFINIKGNKGQKNIKQFMSIKAPNIQEKLYGDYDKDGVRNVLDCEPTNPKKQGFIDSFGNYISGRGWKSNEQLAMQRVEDEQAMKGLDAMIAGPTTLDEQIATGAKELELARQRKAMTEVEGGMLPGIAGEQQKLALAEQKLKLAQKERQLTQVSGKYPEGPAGWMQGIRDIGGFGYRGVQTAVGPQGRPYTERIMALTGSHRDPLTAIDKQISINRVLGNNDKVMMLEKQREMIAKQVAMPQSQTMPQTTQPQVQQPQMMQYPQTQGQEIVEKEGVTYIRQPNGKWLNTKTGKEVTYLRGKYDNAKQRQTMSYPQLQPVQVQPIPQQQLMY